METLRRYMESLPPERTGWLAGARDSVVGQALAHLHCDATRSWTLVDLAKASRTSRTVLAERFMTVAHRVAAASVPGTRRALHQSDAGHH
jgi:hypothetical protein